MTSENGNMYMPVVPQGGYGNGMFGGDGAWWIIILLIFGGWGNNGFGGNGYGAEIQRGFDQNSIMNGLANIQNSIQNASSNNQLGIADLKYTVATEACADRNAISMALRDVLESNNAGVQKVLDTMCQDKIDAKNETIALLRQQLTMAQLSASQNQQTAQILADNAAQTVALEQYLAPVPKPAYTVQNPNCCQQNWGYGCGMA